MSERVLIHVNGIPVETDCAGCKYLSDRIADLEVNRIRQVDENRKISKRVDELDKFHSEFLNVLKDDIKNHEKMWNDVYKRLEKLESLSKFNMSPEVQELFNFSMKEMDERIEKLEHIIGMTNDKAGKLPFKCPVCNGCAMRPNPLRGSANAQIPVNLDCIACQGKGIVWS